MALLDGISWLCLTGGRPADAIDHCREAAAIAAAAGFDELDGDIQSCLAQAYIVAGELRGAITAGERALSIFEARANLWDASRALWHLSSAANYLGDWEVSLAYCRRALAHATTLNDVRLKGVTLWRTGCAYVQQGDFEQCLRCCDEALALEPIPYDSAMTRLMHGYGLIKAGRLNAGIAELTDVVAWFQRSRLGYARAFALSRLAEGHLALGDSASARPLIEEVLSISRATGYLHYEAVAHRLMAECLEADEPAAAEEHVESALRVFEDIGARNDLAKALVTKAGLRQAAGDIATAGQLLHRAYGIFQALGTLDELARVEAALAALGPHSRRRRADRGSRGIHSPRRADGTSSRNRDTALHIDRGETPDG
jgi:tetratricopeptide (TPR) repeat protein